MTEFSAETRKRFIAEASTTEFDLIIIGGGITGAGILLDAVSRGLNVLLIEMNDFASGTSGRSTKLIHGGLRYLKNFEFKLVADVGKERAIVFKNGPHVTKSDPMLLPIIKGRSMGKTMASIGVWLYDFLAKVKKEERRKVLSSKEVNELEPLIPIDSVNGGILYYEYRTDDSRLTVEIIKKAVEMGGKAVNYCQIEDFYFEGDKIRGVVAKDHIAGNGFTIRSKYVVNAAGPWVDQLMIKDKLMPAARLILTKGVHLVFSSEKLPMKRSLYFENSDKRMIFIIPREGKTYIGTTDTFYQGDVKEPKVEKEDVEYLLKAVKIVFPSLNLQKEDIESCWAGLRPLIHEEGKSPSEISRKDEIFVSQSGLISVAGGKLTGYRKMASKVMDKIAFCLKREYSKTISSCKTESISYSGGDFSGKDFKSFVNHIVLDDVGAGLSIEKSRKVVEIYGSNASIIFDIINNRKEEQIRSGLHPLLFARLIYALEYECVLKVSDFFIRRTSMLYFDKGNLMKWKEKVIRLMKEKLGWNDEEERRNGEEMDYQLSLLNLGVEQGALNV